MNSLHFRLLVDVQADRMQQRVVLRHGDRHAAVGVLTSRFATLILTVDVGRRMVVLETALIAATDFGQSVHPFSFLHAVGSLDVQRPFRLDHLR